MPRPGINSRATSCIGDMERPMTMEEEMRAARTAAKGDDLRQAVVELGNELRSAIKELGITLSAGTANKPAVTIAEAQRLLGCGRVKVFALIKAGSLKKAEKSGRLTLVTTESIERALATPPPRACSAHRRTRTGDGAWKPMDARRLRV